MQIIWKYFPIDPHFLVIFQHLNESRPIGLISSSIGGMLIENIVPKEVIPRCYGDDFLDQMTEPFVISDLYWKDFVQPFMKNSLKGVIYGQGEFSLIVNTQGKSNKSTKHFLW